MVFSEHYRFILYTRAVFARAVIDFITSPVVPVVRLAG